MNATKEAPTMVAVVPPDVAPATGIGPQLAPWGAMSALIIAATAIRIAEVAVGNDADVAYGVAAGAFTIAVVTAVATRRKLTSKHLRRRFLAATYLGAAWLTIVASTHLYLGPLALLTIVGAGLSLAYWREHRIPNGPGAPVLVESDIDDLYVTRWDKNLGADGKQLAGSKLTHPEIIKAGYRYVLELVPGSQTVATALNMPDTLRSGLRLLPGQDVIVEEHPTLPAPAAVLTIVTRPQVAKPQKWPGPAKAFDPQTGSVNLGPFVDGEGVARFGVYKQDGIFGGYIQGGNGSGKSRMIDSIAMSLAASTTHPTVIWYADGQNGSSSPLLSEHADYAALQPEAVYGMLSAAVGVMKINSVENRLNKHVGFRPTLERPGLFTILDECHAILDPNRNPLLAAACQALALRIAREGRKDGVALLMASQSPTLDAFGGAGNGADTLRACLLQGNGLILRSKTSNAKQVFGVEVNPRSFPKLPGYAYLCDPEEGARNAPFRGFWITDEMQGVWPQRITWRTLSTRQANAAGPKYARRREVAAEQAMNDALLLQMADAGMLDEIESMMTELDERAKRPGGDYDDIHPPVRHVERFWIPEAVDAAGLRPGQQKVLDAIRRGKTRPKQIREATKYSESQVYNLLGELIEMGLIRKPIVDGREVYGEYQTAEAA